MSETMIERVAKAVDAEKWENFERYCRLKEYNAEERAERLSASAALQASLSRARAAIEAMRSADNEMLEAMHNAMFAEPFDGTNLPMLGAGFEAAIDAALTPSPASK